MSISIVSENKQTMIFVFVAMLVGSLGYFAIGAGGTEMQGTNGPKLEDAEFKVAFGPDGTMNIFANIKNNEFLSLKVAEGNLIPEEDSMVIGNAQKAKMKSQGIFSSPGSHLINYFGTNITIEGVLVETDSLVDDIQFLGASKFKQINGLEGRIFVKMDEEKTFITFDMNETEIPRSRLAEGNWSGYEIHNIGNSTYYPIVIGAKEAKIMKEKKIFTNTGDIINVFGKRFVVVGVIEETNTILDRLYFVPFGKGEIL